MPQVSLSHVTFLCLISVGLSGRVKQFRKATPQKFNIDTQNCHVRKEIHFPNHRNLVSVSKLLIWETLVWNPKISCQTFDVTRKKQVRCKDFDDLQPNKQGCKMLLFVYIFKNLSSWPRMTTLEGTFPPGRCLIFGLAGIPIGILVNQNTHKTNHFKHQETGWWIGNLYEKLITPLLLVRTQESYLTI